MELLCPAGALPALKAAIDHGADAIYIGLKDDTNARHFAGLNFSGPRLAEAVRYTHSAKRKIHVAINTFAQAGSGERWRQAVDHAVDAGADALIVADIGVLADIHQRYPDQEVHLSVQASATNSAAIRFYHEQFNIKRVVLPRVLALKQVAQLAAVSPVPLEVFAFGSLCIMAEGRCYLSSYVTGESPNTVGACSPARFVDWKEQGSVLESRLNGVVIDRFQKGEKAGYPTLCKGRYRVGESLFHPFEEPTSLNTLELLPQLLAMGIVSVKIEGRQRSPAYVAEVTKVWRAAIDRCLQDPQQFAPLASEQAALDHVSEGYQTTLGAYHRHWQ